MGGHPAKKIMLTETQRKLAEENINLAYHCAHQMKSLPMELEEKISLAFLGLVKAAERYDPDTGYAFATYAAIVIRNEILMEYRKVGKHANDISLDTPISDGYRVMVLADLIPDKRDPFCEINVANLKDFLSNAELIFCGRELDLFREIMKCPGMGQKYYGEKLGVSQTYISRLLKTMRSKVRREILC